MSRDYRSDRLGAGWSASKDSKKRSAAPLIPTCRPRGGVNRRYLTAGPLSINSPPARLRTLTDSCSKDQIGFLWPPRCKRWPSSRVDDGLLLNRRYFQEPKPPAYGDHIQPFPDPERHSAIDCNTRLHH